MDSVHRSMTENVVYDVMMSHWQRGLPAVYLSMEEKISFPPQTAIPINRTDFAVFCLFLFFFSFAQRFSF